MAIESLEINLQTQNCRAFTQEGFRDYPCSTALNGAGEQEGSGCTPRGQHRIRAIIGRGESDRAVFVGRRATGELWTPELHAEHPNHDWILGRILWLCGNERGLNRGGTRRSWRPQRCYLQQSPLHHQLLLRRHFHWLYRSWVQRRTLRGRSDSESNRWQWLQRSTCAHLAAAWWCRPPLQLDLQ